ncbi:hypothetical protein SLEP1_g12407 [Rubroshorea leprosula]|uniref:Uncharacterized protein n=1 Tax=Rubroshorea leprosula TaxID=152421 RepID=A0AAV5ILV5_9ROSI|nr:hypothetical protein SLEP1_g12407 [Rubroshorea leprosula]
MVLDYFAWLMHIIFRVSHAIWPRFIASLANLLVLQLCHKAI